MEQQSSLYPPRPNRNPSANLPNATASLVLGIISIVGSFCLGLPGLICGIIGLILSGKDKKLYYAMPDIYSQSSYGQSNAGRICSIIGVVLGGLITLFYIFYFIAVGTLFWGITRNYPY